MINHIKEIYEIIKSAITKFIDYKKDDIGFWFIKLSGIGLLLLLLYYLVSEVIPLIIGGLIMLYLFFGENISQKDTTQQIQYPPYCDIALDLIFHILQDNATVLNIISPNTISDILPVHYPSIQSINGCIFYKFIVRANSLVNYDFQTAQDLINTSIMQHLQNGYPNLMQSHYYDSPVFYVFKLSADSHHKGYLCISVLLINDDKSYQYANEIYRKSLSSNLKPVISTPLDKDYK